MTERYMNIQTATATLAAILHQPENTGLHSNDTGVLLIVGGPQYRVGSHRQFVKLSRALAAQGISSMRLDTAGMGDSSGAKAPFYRQSVDINAAIDTFFAANKQMKKVVLWGLCDAASAILIKLNQHDARINGVILLNPWVRLQQSHAQTMLKHYYLKQLLSRQFWQKLFSGSIAVGSSIKGLWHTFWQSRSRQAKLSVQTDLTEQNYVDAMLSGWQACAGKVLIITSGNDLTAQEFLSLCQHNDNWRSMLSSAQHCHINEANHTFSTFLWRQQVEQLTFQFIQQLISK